MKIAIFGAGYVGLVNGVCFAEKGMKVTCVDINNQKIKNLQQGKSTIFELGLEKLLKKNIKKQNIFFTTDIKKTITENDIFFIAVGTPPLKDGSSDLQFIYQVAEQIAKFSNENKLIITKSTIPPGTTYKIKEYIQKKQKNIHFSFANNPEFLREGSAVQCCINPDRVVIGIEEENLIPKFKYLYKAFIDESKIIFMDIISAELTKYAANAFLATKISFINQISQFCEVLGADINNIKKGIILDERIGGKFLNAGIGYGGSCLPKDIQSLLATAKNKKIFSPLLQAVEAINEEQKIRFTRRIKDYFIGNLKGKKIGVWGLAFKENTSDIRESPCIKIIEFLKKQSSILHLYDPKAQKKMQKIFPAKKNIIYFDDIFASLQNIDALVIGTNWDQFKNFDYSILKNTSCKAIFDGKNILAPQEILSFGIDYIAVGKKNFIAGQK